LSDPTLLLPVELRRVNHTASTNKFDFTLGSLRKPYNAYAMSHPHPIEQIAERVDRLLLRHEELQRTNTLLAEQLASLTSERDSLKSRLSAARARVDALLERLSDSTSPNPNKGAP
jgi:chromosome segregation ATPase